MEAQKLRRALLSEEEALATPLLSDAGVSLVCDRRSQREWQQGCVTRYVRNALVTQQVMGRR